MTLLTRPKLWLSVIGMSIIASTVLAVPVAADLPTDSGMPPSLDLLTGTPCPLIVDPTKKTDTATTPLPATSPPTSPAAAPASSPQGVVNAAIPSSATDIFTFKPPAILTGTKVANQTMLIDAVFNILMFIAILLFVILIPIGGVRWMLATGDEEGTTKARKLLLNAVIGLTLAVAAEAIGNLAFTQLGIPLNFRQIASTVGIGNGGGSGGSGGSGGNTNSTVPLDQRSVTFLLQTQTSNSTIVGSLNLDFVDGDGKKVGTITTNEHGDGNALTTWTLPKEETTLGVYIANNPYQSDTIVGTLTVPANLTSAGCLMIRLNLSQGLIPVTITATLPMTPPPDPMLTTVNVTLTPKDSTQNSQVLSATVSSNQAIFQANLRVETVYTVTVNQTGPNGQLIGSAQIPAMKFSSQAQTITVKITASATK